VLNFEERIALTRPMHKFTPASTWRVFLNSKLNFIKLWSCCMLKFYHNASLQLVQLLLVPLNWPCEELIGVPVLHGKSVENRGFCLRLLSLKLCFPQILPEHIWLHLAMMSSDLQLRLSPLHCIEVTLAEVRIPGPLWRPTALHELMTLITQ
jgi:hypothetical protein